jgi:hypothetical protein
MPLQGDAPAPEGEAGRPRGTPAAGAREGSAQKAMGYVLGHWLGPMPLLKA